MKAVVFESYGGAEQLQLRDRPKPEPEPGQIRVRVRAVSVNEWDWAALRGTPWINRLFFGLRRPWRQILGSDVSGVVDAVGKDAARFKAGDEVFGDLSGRWGGLAEFVCAPERLFTPKPAAMTHVDAAALPQAGLLALQGLELGGRLQPGDRVLINGAGGGVGTFALQLARRLGVRVTGVDAADKAELIRSLGAEQVIDYQREDFARRPERYRLVLDSRSTRGPFDCARALAPAGRYVTVGGDTDRLLAIFAFGGLAARRGRRLSILGLKANQGLDRLVSSYEAGHLRPVIDGRYPLEDSAAAFRRFGSGRHLGKVVIEVN
jgi:NADPH:quinone reductase-like Zn-dependent oxidoreductase